MTESLKIIVPMAGFGKRLRPHTWSRPKPLVSVAGDTVLGEVALTNNNLAATAPGSHRSYANRIKLVECHL